MFSRVFLSVAAMATISLFMNNCVNGKELESMDAREHSRHLNFYSYYSKYYKGSDSDSGRGGVSSDSSGRKGSDSDSGRGGDSSDSSSSGRKFGGFKSGSSSDDSSDNGGKKYNLCSYWWSKWFKSCRKEERYAIRLNCGSNGYEDYNNEYRYWDVDGNLWYSDNGYYNKGEIENRQDIRDIYDTDDDEIYRTSRFVRDGDLVYTFKNINNGRYFIKLRFAEVFFDRSGERVFDIVVNGEVKEVGVDIWDKVGKDTSLILEYFNLEVKYNNLEIRFRKDRQDPKVNGVEVYQVE